MTNTLEGKIAVITGGTQGLGEATARLFAERGAAGMVICGRNAEKGQTVAADLTSLGVPTFFVRADLARVEDCLEVIAKTDEDFGKVHILVNAAGITDRGSLLNTSPELFDRILAVNLRAPFFLMQAAVRVMQREHISGTIVNVLSMSAHGGQSFLSAYSTSKGAMATLTKNTAFALLRYRIRINGLNIGWMDTPGEDHTQKSDGAGPDWLSEAEIHQPFGRLLKAEEVARAIAFLSGDESGMMTGAIIDFDQSVSGCYDSLPLPAAPGDLL